MDITIESLGTVAGIALFVTLAMTVVKMVLWPGAGGPEQDRQAPVVAVALAIIVTFLADLALPDIEVMDMGQKIAANLLNGLIAGFVSVGAYTATKRAVGQ